LVTDLRNAIMGRFRGQQPIVRRRQNGRSFPSLTLTGGSFRMTAGSLGAAILLAACGSGGAQPTTPPLAPPAASSPAGSPSAAAASPSASPAAPPAGGYTVRLAIAGTGTDASLLIGIDKGFFAEQGLKVETARLNSSDMPPQLASGQLDAGAGSFNVSLVNAVQRGLDLKLVADKARCLPGTGALQMVVRKDLYDSGKVRGPKDFKGLNIGIQSVGSGSEVELAKFLKPGGLTNADVNRKAMTYADMPAAFSNKSIDAAAGPEPFPSQVIDKGLAVSLAKCGDYNPNGEISQVVYGAKFISDHPAEAQKFMVGYLKAVRYFNDAFVKHDPKVLPEVIALIAKDTKTDPKIYQRMDSEHNMWGVDPDGAINVPNLQEDIDFWLANGEIKQAIDLNQVVDMSFAQAAAKQLGPYK
jgi:NitT/TauT family transport system substrate-binding protein